MSTIIETETTTATSTAPMSIRIYNTLSKTKEQFEPVVPGKAGSGNGAPYGPPPASSRWG